MAAMSYDLESFARLNERKRGAEFEQVCSS
jgi:hypothetical protein